MNVKKINCFVQTLQVMNNIESDWLHFLVITYFIFASIKTIIFDIQISEN